MSVKEEQSLYSRAACLKLAEDYKNAQAIYTRNNRRNDAYLSQKTADQLSAAVAENDAKDKRIADLEKLGESLCKVLASAGDDASRENMGVDPFAPLVKMARAKLTKGDTDE